RREARARAVPRRCGRLHARARYPACAARLADSPCEHAFTGGDQFGGAVQGARRRLGTARRPAGRARIHSARHAASNQLGPLLRKAAAAPKVGNMARRMSKRARRWTIIVVIAAAIVAFFGYRWWQARKTALPAGIASGNGRIDSKEVDVASKLPLKVKEVK